MSKIGKMPVLLPAGVEAVVEGRKITIKGPKGSQSSELPGAVKAEVAEGRITLTSSREGKLANSKFGTARAKIANIVTGVSKGWLKELELVGTGYRAEVVGPELVLTIGYSQPVKIEAPAGISFKVEKTVITVEGIDKELVGQVAANIRAARPPEPYKGKGIKYRDEVIRRKAGKAAKAVGAPA